MTRMKPVRAWAVKNGKRYYSRTDWTRNDAVQVSKVNYDRLTEVVRVEMREVAPTRPTRVGRTR